ESVRRFLDDQIEQFEPEVAEGARYALSASGKQLRPVLVALSAHAAGGLGPDHAAGASIVELVHLATLVHDDVIDAAGLRRQRPTVAARYGNRTAVLLGDCLFAHALQLAASFPTTDVCRAVSAATQAVCSGEILQTLRQGRLDQPLDEYFRVIRLKTAELFALACELGALLTAAPMGHRVALKRFGIAFGTAYQVFDDCLDVFGNESTAGKTLGTDFASGKVTLPLLLAHQSAGPGDRSRLESLFNRRGTVHADGLRAILDQHQAGVRAQAVVASHLEAAREALRPLNNAPATAPLAGLTHYLGAQLARLATG
ncbi:MAG: polyprenyl synthetase family protein, partial [Verrucomicrobiales bacterium]|nr:polyprenyl synthetase family protein [Verrucomicrobiales bacterium]